MNTAIAKPLATKPAEQKQTKLLAVMAERYGVESGSMYSILKNTVIKPDSQGKSASDAEVQAFLIIANKYELNPLLKEIHAFASNGSVVPIVGIDGWSTLVNRQPDFDGCDFVVMETEAGELVSITCTMHHKRRSFPVSVTEYYAECKRNTAPWNTMKRRMLRHKAFMQCARIAFGITGLHDEDEARDIVGNSAARMEPRKQVAKSTVGIKGPATAEIVPEPDGIESEQFNEPDPPTGDMAVAAIVVKVVSDLIYCDTSAQIGVIEQDSLACLENVNDIDVAVLHRAETDIREACQKRLEAISKGKS